MITDKESQKIIEEHMLVLPDTDWKKTTKIFSYSKRLLQMMLMITRRVDYVQTIHLNHANFEKMHTAIIKNQINVDDTVSIHTYT